jgi:hypothetical protein
MSCPRRFERVEHSQGEGEFWALLTLPPQRRKGAEIKNIDALVEANRMVSVL